MLDKNLFLRLFRFKSPTKYIIFTLALVLSCSSLAQTDANLEKWDRADVETKRFPPNTFAKLPRNIKAYLLKEGFTIPQSYFNHKAHNVINGKFAKKGQYDWAVLASRNRISEILIFWNGSTKSIARIGLAHDKDFLQTVEGDGKIGFSRLISSASKNRILRDYKEFGGAKPPPIDHEGIEDAFVEKVSSVHYFYRDEWIKLQGAD
jgi:hypothetical protein